MTDVTEFHQRSAAVALVKMFASGHFDICTLDAIARTLGKQARCAGRDYDALRAVHCIDWADMGRDLERMVKEKTLEILELPAQVIDVLQAEQPKPSPEKMRLAFWRR